MSATSLLILALSAIIVLLILVIGLKMSAFVALLLVSFGTALVADIDVADIVPTMEGGMGNTLGSVMIVVGLGAMLGRVIEAGGGAHALAQRFTAWVGPAAVVGAVTAASFIIGIPVFFDVAFILVAPIIFGFARTAHINPLKLGLPVGAALLTVHVVMPPHPGPVSAAGIIGADTGLLLLVSLPIAALTVLIGYQIVKRYPIKGIKLGPSPVLLGQDTDEAEQALADKGTKTHISSAMVIILIALPLVQIMSGTVGAMVLEEGTTAEKWLGMIGSSPIALLTAVIVAYLVVGHHQKWSLDRRGKILDSVLPDVSTIIFVTGAGGVFAGVLVASGIGDALSNALISLNMPIILAGYLICLALRASQGSASVAILTTAGLMAQPIALAGYSSWQVVLVTAAIGLGGLGLSHINDSGFWIVTRYLGLSVKDGLRTWTVITTVFSLIGFLVTAGLFVLVS